ncbi:MAG: nucleotidyltransferase family protein [Mucilaginibacter sp.]
MTGVIILAAGASSRLGQPKQNLVFQGKTLLQRAIENAITSVCETVVVVLGGNAGAIQPVIANQPVSVIFNPDWQKGMASSIRCGLVELQRISPTVSSALLMLCDQPFADAKVLNQLVLEKTNSDMLIVASSYSGTTGTPALFDKSLFPELLALTGQEGAKKLLAKHTDKALAVPFASGAIDIDTMADYERLIQ